MRLIPALVWTLAENDARTAALDPRLLPLLQAIDETGSLAAAVAARGLSYRAAWGLLRDYERRLGVPIAVLSRGRGARLAAAGEALVAAERAAAQRLGRILPQLALDLGGAEPRRQALRLPMAASNDPALAALRDALPGVTNVSLELAFMGSLHALEQLRAGRVDVAGFHVASKPRSLADAAPFRRLLDARRDRLVGFVTREQGLILPSGNPDRVRGLADLSRKRLRFVNRQRGSGTRLLIDRLLAEAGIDSAALAGYNREEFTHAAVAATVASGAADAGFGLRAAASEQGLAFVPCVHERYYLAVRARMLEAPAVARLLEALEGPLLGRIVRRLPGYRCDRPGRILNVDRLGE